MKGHKRSKTEMICEGWESESKIYLLAVVVAIPKLGTYNSDENSDPAMSPSSQG